MQSDLKDELRDETPADLAGGSAAVEIDRLTFAYGQRRALDELSLTIAAGQIFAFLGPNGGGKTTLFRLLSTLVPMQQGAARILGHDLRRAAAQVQALVGVVFQAPSLDKKLTVEENIRYQAALYGVDRQTLRRREALLLEQLGLAGRRRERTETLSGGLRRRVELAKGMIHQPRLLLMDEPSTGLDPGARRDLWQYLTRLRDELQVSVVLTTHLLEEAEKADRIAILNEGKLVACDTPDRLRSSVGGDSITIGCDDPAQLLEAIRERFALDGAVVEGNVRLEQSDGHQWIARLVEAFPDRIRTITLGKPTLEDVFIERTGHRFHS